MNPSSIVITTPATFERDSAHAAPIAPRWVLSGKPITHTWSVLRSRDLTSDLLVWECTEGRFECKYSQDEVVMIVSGEVFITDQSDQERRLGPGDLGFFPAGSSCIWRVPQMVRKIAVLRETMWRPAGIGLKIWKRLRRIGAVATIPVAGIR